MHIFAVRPPHMQVHEQASRADTVGSLRGILYGRRTDKQGQGGAYTSRLLLALLFLFIRFSNTMFC